MTEKHLSITWICVGTAAVSLSLGAEILAGARARMFAQHSTVTFANDVAPILFEACVSCHRPDGSAPFTLLSYEDAKKHADRIAAVTRDRVMPPWMPEPGYGTFADERRLTEEQIRTFREWVDGGAIEGDIGNLPPLPEWSGRWRLGEPDLVIQTLPYDLRATGDDMYRNFVLPVPITESKYVKAWEFLPGNTRVVHHATMEFDPTTTSRHMDSQDHDPGYEGLISHSVMRPDGYFLDWGPGHTPYVAPEGMAWPLHPGTDLVMMLHLRPSGTPETVQATIGLYFSDQAPSITPTIIRLTRQHLDIPPGETQYIVTDSFTLDVDVDVYTVQPHAHYLAREVKGYATLPDGTRKWLIYISDWNFDWQGVYRYENPEFLPMGTTITMEYTYDNSADNPRNPHTPPQRVTYGQRTTDEMAELWLQVVTRRDADRPMLANAVSRKVALEGIRGYEMMIESDPTNVALHNDVALLHAQLGNLDRTEAHFRAVLRIQPTSAPAHHNVGTVLLMQARADEAAAYFRQALTLAPGYARAHHSLAVVLQGQGRLAEAIEHHTHAVTLEPENADWHYHLALALRADGRLTEAIPHFRRTLELDSTRKAVESELADVERESQGHRH